MIRPAIANALMGAEHSSLAGPETLSAVSNDQILSEAGPRKACQRWLVFRQDRRMS